MESRRSADALILTYHAIDDGGSPLAIEPALFREHLDRIVASGRPVVTVAELAERVRAHDAAGAVAITFDDGFASVVENALPLLRERELSATVFCVASRIGDVSDWPSDRAHGTPRRLADAEDLAEARRSGLEIGAHGLTHAPLVTDDEELLWHELEGARAALEVAVGGPIRSLAYPYGVASPTARSLAGTIYGAVCTTELRPVGSDDSPHALPRVDAHYLRRPELLGRALDGSLALYLRLRALGARARRRVRPDYRTEAASR